MDYLAYDRASHRVWVPAGNTGKVDVIDSPGDRVTSIDGFPTAEVERGGSKRTVGPSSATVGDGVVYVGNRANANVCAVDAKTLKLGSCVTLSASPDGLAYVASEREVWVTMPRDRSIMVLDVSAAASPKHKTKIKLAGAPEGFAVDDARGMFYTNLEDKDRTLAIDIRSRKIAKDWPAGCGEKGPRGLAFEPAGNHLVVACTDRVEVLDSGHDGGTLSVLKVGDGVDNIDYLQSHRQLYAAAAQAAQLTIARLGENGVLTAIATVATAPGARNAVASDDGTAYLTDSLRGGLLVVAPAATH